MTDATTIESNIELNVVQPVDEVSKSIKFFWGSGALGVSLLMNAFSFLILFYMVGVLKIEPALAGTLIFLTKLADVVSDPIVGLWSDRLKGKNGRRRPFLLPGAVLSGLAFAMIFTTPMFESQVLISAYIFGAMIIYTIGYTMFNVPYMSMPAEMTDSFHERSSIHAYRVVFVTIGGFLAGSIAPWALEVMGKSEWSSYATIGVVGGITVFLSMSVTYFGTANARYTYATKTTPKILGEISAIMANPFFLRLIAIKACQLFAVAASGAAMIFFIVSSLQLDLKVLAVFFAVLSVVSIISAPILVNISKQIGKPKTYILSASCYVLYAASWYFAVPGEALWALLVRAVIVGVAVTGNILLAMSMLTDTIEYDAKVTGVRREGAYTALYSFTEKFTFAFGPLVVGIAMSVAGFDKALPPEDMQSPAVRQALLLGMCYIPVVMGLLSMLLLKGYRLDEQVLAEASPSNRG